MRRLLYILFILISLNTYATDYYVKNGGNDSNSGTSDAQAWASLSKVNSSSFSPGDRIYFRRGDTWSGTLYPPSSGNSGARITFGAYGTGDKPVITIQGALPGWTTSGNWTQQDIEKWSISWSGNVRVRMWLNGSEAQKAQSTYDVSYSYPFYVQSGSIWVYAITNPASYYSSMDVSGTASYVMYMNSKSYITFENIDFRGGGGGGWRHIHLTGCNYVTFQNCYIGMDDAIYGLYAESTDNVIITGCVFDTGDRTMDYWQAENSEDGIAIFDGCDNWEISYNTFTSWGHACVSVTKDNTGSSLSNIKIHHNYFNSPDIDYGRAFELEGVLGGTQTGIEFYNNLCVDMPTQNQICFPYAKIYNNIINGIRDAPYFHYGGAVGLWLQEYSSYRAYQMQIYNNTIVNCDDQALFIMEWGATGITGNEIINNIFAYNGVNYSNEQIRIENSNISSNIYRNNLIYSPSSSNTVRYRGSTYTVSAWNSADSNGDVIANNIASFPNFISYSNDDFHLTSSSPARGAGYNSTLSSADYDGVTWGSPPSIGAYEYDEEEEPPSEGEGEYVKHEGKYVKYNGQYVKW